MKQSKDGTNRPSLTRLEEMKKKYWLYLIGIILLIILFVFGQRYSKETEKRVEELLKQKKMEQKDPHSQE